MTVSVSEFWGLVVVLGLTIFLQRFSFFAIVRGKVSPRLMAVLRPIPAAVLAGIVVPAVVLTKGDATALENGKLAAGVAAAVVAWRTRGMFFTIAAGMATLWLWRWLF